MFTFYYFEYNVIFERRDGVVQMAVLSARDTNTCYCDIVMEYPSDVTEYSEFASECIVAYNLYCKRYGTPTTVESCEQLSLFE